MNSLLEVMAFKFRNTAVSMSDERPKCDCQKRALISRTDFFQSDNARWQVEQDYWFLEFWVPERETWIGSHSNAEVRKCISCAGKLPFTYLVRSGAFEPLN